MTNTEMEYLQRAEGYAWIELANSHYDFMSIHGTFNSYEEYDKALRKYTHYWICAAKWHTLSLIITHFNIPYDKKLHGEAMEISLKEPKHFN